MKHLKALLAAYRVTTPNTTNTINKCINTVLESCCNEVDTTTLHPVQKILAAVVADLRDEDAKALKAVAK